MKIKKERGIAGADMVIAIVAIMIFSTLIISMIYNNTVENVKLKKETLAMIYMTEIFENVGIANYNNVTAANSQSWIPAEANNDYVIDIDVITTFSGIENYKNIMKKVKATISWQVDGKTYSYSMERIKAKE